MLKEVAKTRSDMKRAILETLTVIFTKGFKKWHEDRIQEGTTNLLADSLKVHKISLRKGSPEIKRRFYYYCKVYKALLNFVVELEEAEKLILDPKEFDEFRVPLTYKSRQEITKLFAETYGEEEAQGERRESA